MATTIKADEQPRYRVLSLYEYVVKGDHASARLNNLSQQGEQFTGLGIVHVVQYG